MAFNGFSPAERSFLAGQRLGRLATVSPTGIVGNAPVTFFVRSDDTVDIGGNRMGETKKFRNVAAGSRVAFVVDDLTAGRRLAPALPGDQGHRRGAVRRRAAGQRLLPRGDQDPPGLGALVRTGQSAVVGRVEVGRPCSSLQWPGSRFPQACPRVGGHVVEREARRAPGRGLSRRRCVRRRTAARRMAGRRVAAHRRRRAGGPFAGHSGCVGIGGHLCRATG